MAFTDAQKISIRRFLGYPLGYYQYNTPLESMIDKVGVVPAEQAAVESILVELAAVDVVIAAGGSTVGAGSYGALKQVDEVQFYSAKDSLLQASDVITAMKRARMLVGRLADAMGGRGIIKADYFATGNGSSSFELRMG